jgi:hypothetical protein
MMSKITFFPEQYAWVAHPAEVNVSLDDVTEGEAVFVSGKLMDPEFVRGITGHYIPFGAAVARNYTRGERGRGAKKTLVLEHRPGGAVLGAILLKLTDADIRALDAFEQVPKIRRKTEIRVSVGACERMASTYVPR